MSNTTSSRAFNLTNVRIAFWVTTLFLGIFTIYTSRHFINTDGLIYIEMSDGVKTGEWSRLINLACSPLYAVLLGAVQLIFQPTPFTELAALKVSGFLGLLSCMFACEYFLYELRRLRILCLKNESACLILTALVYALFVIAVLIWVKDRLINPDLFAFCAILTAAAALTAIRCDPESLRSYVILGAALGLGYLTKTYILVMAPVFLLCALWAGGLTRRVIAGVCLASVIIALLAAPLVVGLSMRVGRPSIGEAANFAYTTEVAVQGTAEHIPELLYPSPKTVYFHYGAVCTDAFGYDIAYWSLGLKARWNMRTQLKTLTKNLAEFLSHTGYLFGLLAAFVGFMYATGQTQPFHFKHRAIQLILAFVALCGIGLFALVYMEMRYVAPFGFLLGTALLLGLNYKERFTKVGVAAGLLLLAVFVGFILYGVMDQMDRGVRSHRGKASHSQIFEELTEVTRFLQAHGAQSGDKVALVGAHYTYWARMGRFRIVARIPDEREFLASSPERRAAALAALGKAGIKAVVAAGDAFTALAQDGWHSVPKSGKWVVFFPEQHRPDGSASAGEKP